jgi:hypothetical protein
MKNIKSRRWLKLGLLALFRGQFEKYLNPDDGSSSASSALFRGAI